MKFSPLIFAVLLASTACAQLPSTQPSDMDRLFYAAGYADGMAGKPPALIATTQPIAPVAPVTQPVNVPPIAVKPIDLAPIVNGMHAAKVLPPGVYVLNQEVDLLYSLDGSGSTLTCNKTSTNFRIKGANVTLANFTVPQGGIFVLDMADAFTLKNCEFGIGKPSGSVVQVLKTDKGGTNASIVNCQASVTATCSIYVEESGSLIDNCTFAGAEGEYAVRYEIASQGGAKPFGAKIVDCTITNHNSLHKESIGPRMIDNLIIDGGTISGPIRFGQTPPGGTPITNPTLCNGNNVIRGTRIDLIPGEDKESAITIHSGSTVLIDGVTFGPGCNKIAPPTTVDTGSVLTIQNTTQEIAAGDVAKKLVATSAKGVSHIGAGNSVKTVK